MKKLTDYLDPTLWLLAIQMLAIVYLLVERQDKPAGQKNAPYVTNSITRQPPTERKNKMSKLKITPPLLLCALVLSACQSPSVRVVQPPTVQIPPLPAEIQAREPNLRQRLQLLWQASPPTATTLSTTSTPASTRTTSSGTD